MTNLSIFILFISVFVLVPIKTVAAKNIKYRPYAEYERVDYLMITDPFIKLLPYLKSLNIPDHEFKEHDRASFEMKSKIIKNLPKDIQLVIIHIDNSKKHLRRLKKYLDRHLGEKRAGKVKLVFKEVTSGKENLGLFWARDSFPIPLIRETRQKFLLADISFDKKYKYAEPDKNISKFLKRKLVKAQSHKLEGGNFLATSKGECFSVISDEVDEDFFKERFGCINAHLLPQKGGIGHMDERLKFLNDKEVLTDEESYAEYLEDLGYDVTMLPRAKGGKWRTYLNSMILNDTIFIPVYGNPEDKKVIDIYKSFGFKVIPIDSKFLSDEGAGSIHCFTATYPK